MEERKLNYNAPLLSVRRFSTTKTSSDGAKGKRIERPQLNKRHTLPLYKSDLNLDQVTEPVAVPFHWEQIPGRPKGGSTPEARVGEEASVTPRIPPGRVLDTVKHCEEKKVDDRNVLRPQIQAKSFKDNGNELDCSKEEVNEKAGLDLENDDDDDVYSDALDTLSPVDSYSMNCSVSGLSSNGDLVVKPSGTFSMDAQTRDFMMSRFLPAAKAMALEPPHYASRKQPAAVEQSRQITKVASRDRTPPPNLQESHIIPYYSQDIEKNESEEEYDEYDGSGNISAKACGWFPRLRFKNSLCLLNPVPGMKLRAQASMSSTRDVGKESKASYARSYSQTMRKHSKDAVYKQKPDSGVQSPRLLEVENKLASGSNRFTNASDRQTISRTSPFRRSGGISPYRNETPQSSFRGRGFLGIPKEAENFKANRLNLYCKSSSKSQELFSHYGTKRGSRPVSPIIEKTVYVDTVNMAEMSCSNSGSSDIKDYVDSAGKGFRTLSKSREMDESTAQQSSFQDSKCPNVPEEEGELEHKLLGSGDADLLFPSDISPLIGQAEMMEDSCQESKALVCISTTADGNLNIDCDQISKDDDPGNVKTSFEQSPLPPVLPKTPSESWLWRTLPSISSQNPFSHLYRGASFQSKWQDSKRSSTNTKWETIVKSSYSHHDHVRYSEELIPHASQQSKS